MILKLTLYVEVGEEAMEIYHSEYPGFREDGLDTCIADTLVREAHAIWDGQGIGALADGYEWAWEEVKP
jgi:hypothetical protein